MEDKAKEKLINTLQLITIEHLISRLDCVADKYETLFDESEKFFKDMREQFLKDIIKEQVNLEMEKNKRGGVAKYHG